MKPDSHESFWPSQRGRTRKRRIKRPRMLRAQASAKRALGRIEAAEEAGGVKKAEAKADGAMVQRDERKGKKCPEDEGMRDAGQRRSRMTLA